MTHTFKCPVCSRELSLSDKVFDQRVAGKRVSIKCKHCNAPLSENDASQNSTATSDGEKAANPNRPPKPSLDTVPSKLFPAPVTAPPRPRQVAPALAQDSNASHTTVPRPASAGSAANQPSSTGIAPATPSLVTRPPLTRRGNAPNDKQVSLATPLSSGSPSPTAAIAPMPIVSVGRDAAISQLASATTPNLSPLPTTVVSSAEQSNQSSSESPTSLASRHSENEITPPAMTLAPSRELPQSLPPDSSTVAPKRFPNQRAARWVLALGSAAALLVVALAFGLGTPKKEPPPRGPTKSAPRTGAVRGITQSTGACLPPAAAPAATGVAGPLAVPTVVAPVEASVTPPAEKPSSVPSPSSDTKDTAAGDDTVPDYVSKPTLTLVTDVAIRRAQRCHPHGHAAGTARLFMTFTPNGRVTDVRIEGEPVASAPVAGCILDRVRSIRIAKFEGAPFTYTKSITMH
jgi:hypothetical protein